MVREYLTNKHKIKGWKRYQEHVASVLSHQFEIIESWTYSDFCKVMTVLVNQPVDKLNSIAFEMLDYNSDGFISEIDLFVLFSLGNYHKLYFNIK